MVSRVSSGLKFHKSIEEEEMAAFLVTIAQPYFP